MDANTITLKIESLTYGPSGVGRKEGRVFLVPLAVPGDEVEIRTVEEKNNFSVGEIARLVRPSDLRRPPPCPYAGQCGGCPWQQVRYQAQLAAKEKSVADALQRIGKLGGFELLPIRPSPQEHRYRRRIRLHADNAGRLGFHRAFSHDLVEIDSCLIADPRIEARLPGAREWIRGLRTKVRHVEIVTGDGNEENVLAGKADGEFSRGDQPANDRFLERHGEFGGLVLFGRGWRRAWGREKITLPLENGLALSVDAELFSQVNREGNRRLAEGLLSWGEFHGGDRVLELYCGAGNFTLSVARRVREVVAVEGDPRAVENGAANGRLNGLENIRWLRSHVPAAIPRLRDEGQKFSKIILNPPRSGAKGIEQDLALLGAGKILYVSCNPATLARDLAALARTGYRAARVQPVDLFPQSFHVETLAEMVRGAAANPIH